MAIVSSSQLGGLCEAPTPVLFATLANRGLSIYIVWSWCIRNQHLVIGYAWQSSTTKGGVGIRKNLLCSGKLHAWRSILVLRIFLFIYRCLEDTFYPPWPEISGSNPGYVA
ncbi:unnamed protein product [Victoria cruziana]